MYHPEIFAQNDRAAQQALMEQHPFAVLLSNGKAGLEANPLPFLYCPDSQKLLAHVSRGNPVWRNVKSGAEVLVVFQGVNTYISPNYYASKARDGKVVPTWNYIAVEVRGRLHWVMDTAAKREIVERLTTRHEASQASPWQVSDAPEDYLQGKLAGIVGLEVAIDTIQGKGKLNQNHPEENRRSVIAALQQPLQQPLQQQAGTATMVEAMRATIEN